MKRLLNPIAWLYVRFLRRRVRILEVRNVGQAIELRTLRAKVVKLEDTQKLIISRLVAEGEKIEASRQARRPSVGSSIFVAAPDGGVDLIRLSPTECGWMANVFTGGTEIVSDEYGSQLKGPCKDLGIVVAETQAEAAGLAERKLAVHHGSAVYA